jgi:hypothetical protein
MAENEKPTTMAMFADMYCKRLTEVVDAMTNPSNGREKQGQAEIIQIGAETLAAFQVMAMTTMKVARICEEMNKALTKVAAELQELYKTEAPGELKVDVDPNLSGPVSRPLWQARPNCTTCGGSGKIRYTHHEAEDCPACFPAVPGNAGGVA